MIKTRSIEAISKNLCSGDTASVVEKKLEEPSVTGGVGVCNCFGVAEGIEERVKCANLICDFRLPFRVGREPEELVYKEI